MERNNAVCSHILQNLVAGFGVDINRQNPDRYDFGNPQFQHKKKEREDATAEFNRRVESLFKKKEREFIVAERSMQHDGYGNDIYGQNQRGMPSILMPDQYGVDQFGDTTDRGFGGFGKNKKKKPSKPKPPKKYGPPTFLYLILNIYFAKKFGLKGFVFFAAFWLFHKWLANSGLLAYWIQRVTSGLKRKPLPSPYGQSVSYGQPGKKELFRSLLSEDEMTGRQRSPHEVNGLLEHIMNSAGFNVEDDDDYRQGSSQSMPFGSNAALGGLGGAAMSLFNSGAMGGMGGFPGMKTKQRGLLDENSAQRSIDANMFAVTRSFVEDGTRGIGGNGGYHEEEFNEDSLRVDDDAVVGVALTDLKQQQSYY